MRTSYYRFMAIIIAMNVQMPAKAQLIKYEIGAGLGAVIYQGDLAPSAAGSFKTIRPAFHLYGSKIMNSFFSVRAQLAFGQLRGNESLYDHPSWRRQRNFNFSSPLVELSGLLVWNPLGKNNADKGFSPYLFGGGGIGLLKIKRDWSRLNTTHFDSESAVAEGLVVDAAHPLPNIIPVIPVGAGLRYNFSSRLAVSAESSYRFVFTDYLDGFSQSANPSRNDHYYTITIGLIYRIGKKNAWNCPAVK